MDKASVCGTEYVGSMPTLLTPYTIYFSKIQKKEKWETEKCLG